MEDPVTTYKFLGMHFCFEETHPVITEDVRITTEDASVIKELAKQLAEYAADPVNDVRKELWKKVNGLRGEKPMIWYDEVCWHEMNQEDELILITEHPLCRIIETELKRQIYQWKYMPGDMVIEPVVYAPLAVFNTGIGLEKEMEIVKTDIQNDVVSRHFIITIKDECDIEKIKYPEIIHDYDLSNVIYNRYQELFDGILTVRKRGAPGFWFAPWDDIVMYTGVQEALLDLVLHPEYVKHFIEKLVDVGLRVLDQYEEQNILSSNNYNIRVGSGAYGYTDELPRFETGKDTIPARKLWGCCTAQIFSEVSPAMHEEFALQYERKWLERFGLTYYGCCEPLHHKVEHLRAIQNLRKISISPYADLAAAKDAIGDDYVISYKPSPAVLANKEWDPSAVKADLKKHLSVIRDCNVEVIMKDISTVRYQPRRLWEWVKIASEVSLELSG